MTTATTTATAVSADGTTIAAARTGSGPAVVLVGGAFNDRSTVAGLAAALAPHHTAWTYDRRGRGDSPDTRPYAVEREIEDLAAVVDLAGGSAAVVGHSSGAVLALLAAARGVGTRVAAYEPSYLVGEFAGRQPADLPDRLAAAVAAGRRADAVALFLTDSVGVPAQFVEAMAGTPEFAGMTALAHTLPYDVAVCGDRSVPAELGRIRVPVLVLDGGDSGPDLRSGARAAAAAVPGAAYVTLEGQDHGVLHRPEALLPVLLPFLA